MNATPRRSYVNVRKMSDALTKVPVNRLDQSTIERSERKQCPMLESTTEIRSPPTTMTSFSFNFYEGRINAVSS